MDTPQGSEAVETQVDEDQAEGSATPVADWRAQLGTLLGVKAPSPQP